MMSKERLQEIKSYFKRIVDEKRNVNPHLNVDDITFLIKQAERVQELEGVLQDINENSSCTIAVCYTRKALEEK